MVYRDVTAEEAHKRYTELTQAHEAAAPTEITTVRGPMSKPKRKTVKALVPKK
jgi:hypothetical protein